MTNEEKRKYKREYRKKNKRKLDRMPSVRKNYEANYADYIMKQVEMAEERRGWDV